MKLFKLFLKNETVLCVSFLLAVLSAFVIKPDMLYLTYPDYRTIALLFCLMIIVAGFQSLGIFRMLGHFLITRAGSIRGLSVVMILLCFFSSMVITNDVTLITFVPFTILVLRMSGRVERILKLVVLETIAANLGSMATPIGNPQNLYLYSISDLTAGEFMQAVLPYAGLSLILLVIVVFVGKDEPLLDVSVKDEQEKRAEKKAGRVLGQAMPLLILLILCLLVVFRILPYQPVLICVILVILVIKRKLYLSVDYFLLLTFLCFFVFIGNVKRIPQVSEFLVSAVQGRELLAGILTSQIISNVPAAILLSGFSSDYSALLTGVNLGGLGTLIASLASLISFKFFVKEYPDKKVAFLKVFTIWNLLFLLVLAAEAFLIGMTAG
ncbi:SLC13 family permease [Mediterraneibacter glycyrrhizinilyticus]|uniref:SLC13 family permease n=1 Tax=Mediterraneibacter glycyrrhizinilyticus TaxID=342942 RepID=UPI0025AA9D07|nr:SLC13 family permease [Mediterraneibacter glycyrrhizinilyticus]MDN0045014.1 SLC13 family permease [Mediterraneibacter glycyrrhizinilyticus]